MGNDIRLGTVAGVPVSASWSLVVILGLITWTLGAVALPEAAPDTATAVTWSVAVVAAVAFLACLLLHELAHAVVARSHGMRVDGITLWMFGGVSRLGSDPPDARTERRMALAGPLASVALGVGFVAVAVLLDVAGAPDVAVAATSWLGVVNVTLAAFNMLPAFPLDGGRVLRAILWGWKGNYLRATRIASNFGSGFGLLLILLAVLSIVSGNFIAGMWYFLIGLFVRGAAQATYQQTLMRETLHDVPVARLMTKDPVTVDPAQPLDELVDKFFYAHNFKAFPVVEGGRLLGYVNLRDVKKVPRDQWRERAVGDIMEACSEENTVTPGTDAAAALTRMMRSRRPRLLVASKDRLAGVVSQSDLLRFLAIKLNLEGEAGDSVETSFGPTP